MIEATNVSPAYRIELVRTKVAEPATSLSSPQDVARYLEHLARYDREHLIRLDLDVRCQLISVETVHIGTVDAIQISPREIFRGALLSGARQVIIAHNHPSGDPSPSDEDRAVADKLKRVGELMDIPVTDFCIVADGEFWSWMRAT
mgnify:CR=1 FL=1